MLSKSSSVSLPHCSFILPFACFQFPAMRSQFMCGSSCVDTGVRYTEARDRAMPPNAVPESGRKRDGIGLTLARPWLAAFGLVRVGIADGRLAGARALAAIVALVVRARPAAALVAAPALGGLLFLVLVLFHRSPPVRRWIPSKQRAWPRGNAWGANLDIMSDAEIAESDPSSIPLGEAHRTALDEALAEHARNPDDVVSLDDVMANARRR